MEGLVVTNKYGNKELRVNDSKGGHLTVVLYPDELRHSTGKIGLVASYTNDNVGGTEVIRTKEDIDLNIAGIERIRRLDTGSKQPLIDFLLEIKNTVTV